MTASPKLRTIPSEEVDTTGSWLFWAKPPDDALLRSIAEQGQLEPVLITEEKRIPILVAGYKRVLACRVLEREVLALPLGQLEWATKGRIYLESNRQCCPDVSDLVLAGRYFYSLLETRDLRGLLQEIAGEDAGKKLPELITTWLRLAPEWDELLRYGHIPVQAAETLVRLGPEDLASLRPFFRDLRWSKNNALRFLTWLEEAASRERTTLSLLIEWNGLQRTLEQKLSPKDKIQRLVQRAREIRYPYLCGLEAEFASITKEMGSTCPWQISPDTSFESDRVHLAVSLGSPQELQNAARELNRLLEDGVLDRIWAWQRKRLKG